MTEFSLKLFPRNQCVRKSFIEGINSLMPSDGNNDGVHLTLYIYIYIYTYSVFSLLDPGVAHGNVGRYCRKYTKPHRADT